jgi:murein DD-endopeptidase MepM/ murein hydrolase activator NlpD
MHRLLWPVLLACSEPELLPLAPYDLPIRHVTVDSIPVADGFDYPVGPPDAADYYDAQPFGGDNMHLGSDWNGTGGGNTDLGDPIHSIANGMVTDAYDQGGGWGGVVMVVHRIPDPEGGEDRLVESLYAHLQRIDVAVGDSVTRGASLGTMGNVGGLYLAHLHFEIRARPGVALGGGYGWPGQTHLDPTVFIEAHRPEAR